MSGRRGLLCSASRSVVVATIAALVLTMAEPPMAAASSAGLVKATMPSSDATDFSARRRHYRGGNAAGTRCDGDDDRNDWCDCRPTTAR